MAKKSLFDKMVLIPEYEYTILKEKNKNKNDTSDTSKTANSNLPSPQIPSLPPGIPESSLNSAVSRPNTTKSAISTNWNVLWEPL